MVQKKNKKTMTPNQFEIFYVLAVIVTLQSTKTTVALFLAGGDKVGYFLERQ